MTRFKPLFRRFPTVLAAFFMSLLVLSVVKANAHDEASRQLGPIVRSDSLYSDHTANSSLIFSLESVMATPTSQVKTNKPAIDPLYGPFVIPLAPAYQSASLTPPHKLLQNSLAKPGELVAKISIIIDDLGYNRQGMESSLELPTQVALAILPHTPFGKKTALRSMEQNRVTLLHAPMENLRELKLGPGGLYVSMSESEFKSVLRDDLDSLPGIKGVNNHMGSLLTTNSQAMNWVMQVLGEGSLFFVDSVTSADSVAYMMAKRHSIDSSKRDVFLDNVRDEKAIDVQFEKLIHLARKKGHAIAIGHPYPETIRYLSKRLKELSSLSVTLVPIDELVRETTNKSLELLPTGENGYQGE